MVQHMSAEQLRQSCRLQFMQRLVQLVLPELLVLLALLALLVLLVEAVLEEHPKKMKHLTAELLPLALPRLVALALLEHHLADAMKDPTCNLLSLYALAYPLIRR